MTQSIRVQAPAKINLFLRVVRRRSDGYHELETLFQAIDLWDELIFSATNGSTTLEAPGRPELEFPGNLVLRAVRWLEAATGNRIQARIQLIKRIPVAAGLGGGSSNAAAALVGLNELFGLGLSQEELKEGALSLGADVPFFLTGGTALGQGIGEILTRVDYPLDYSLVLVNPGFTVSTAAVFKRASMRLTERPGSSNLKDQAREGVRPTRLLHNDLQPVTQELYPEVIRVFELLADCGWRDSLMTGSGPTVFSISDPDTDAHLARVGELKKTVPANWKVINTRPLSCGLVVD